MAHPRGFTILAVCTGNVCRSPAVERLLRPVLGNSEGVTVHSAGLGALVDAPIDEPMADLLRAQGADVGGFAARQITEPMVREADLILPLTREHRASVVALHPAAVRRTFTLRELARLADQVDRDELAAASWPGTSPADRLAALVPLAAARRAHVPAELDDVVDPFRRTPQVYKESLAQIVPAVQTIAQIALNL
ncbi:low molecular weight phosphatase family protein [Georgenia thermotolerans]|uniref:Low molecular weight phosphatase family protein n=1 Tax=Georgenia thermotolerans TaxID=527326 RepID=A0A7J5UR81_9MICO|nr:low molecular weight phosphatase family protein [Georgenia thermotolerans]KAE8764393.1 low molecular weight phosphatase family protein [Georgenia thermotolerans]